MGVARRRSPLSPSPLLRPWLICTRRLGRSKSCRCNAHTSLIRSPSMAAVYGNIRHHSGMLSVMVRSSSFVMNGTSCRLLFARWTWGSVQGCFSSNPSSTAFLQMRLSILIGTFLCVGLILERIAIIPTFHCVLSDVADAPVGERHF